MKESIKLPPEILECLGRIAWSAMNLEDWTRSTCDLVLKKFDTKHHIGEYINLTVAELARWNNPELTAFVTGWLLQAKSAMERRNQILHAVPVHVMDIPSTDAPDRQAIVYFPRRARDGSREASVQTVLDVESLSKVAQQIEDALDGYTGAHSVALSNRRWRDREFEQE